MSETSERKCVCQGAGPELSQLLMRLGPGEAAVSHFKAARVEMLKGIRAMIDRQIESIEKPASRGAKVTVE
jgi:hypothetical protein